MSPKDQDIRPRRYYSKELKDKVVAHLVNGEYLVEEVMERYDIPSKKTIIVWLQKYLKEKK